MYKIEGEDLYLIGTSEHSMIGKFIDQIIPEEELPKTLTSYSPCFRKEKGAHGLEERGVYRIHQFEKQEMIVVCNPEDSKMWFDKLWQNTVDLFRSLDIPVRTLECCSGDLADLKVKSLDVEAWSPRQKKYFEVGSCSNLNQYNRIMTYDEIINAVENGAKFTINFQKRTCRVNGKIVIEEFLDAESVFGRDDSDAGAGVLQCSQYGLGFQEKHRVDSLRIDLDLKKLLSS